MSTVVHPLVSNGTGLQLSANITQQNTNQQEINQMETYNQAIKSISPTQIGKRENTNRAEAGRGKENRKMLVKVTLCDLLFL